MKRYFSDDEEIFEDDEVKCLRVVRSVLDEETVLEMVITFLQMTHDNSIPQTASIIFSSCYFDKESGLINHLFIYMLVMKDLIFLFLERSIHFESVPELLHVVKGMY